MSTPAKEGPAWYNRAAGFIWGAVNGAVSGVFAGTGKLLRSGFGFLGSIRDDTPGVMTGKLSPLDIWKINRSPMGEEREQLRAKLLKDGANRSLGSKIFNATLGALGSLVTSASAAAYNAVGGVVTFFTGAITGAALGVKYGATEIGLTGVYNTLKRPGITLLGLFMKASTASKWGLSEAEESVFGKRKDEPVLKKDNPVSKKDTASSRVPKTKTTENADTTTPAARNPRRKLAAANPSAIASTTMEQSAAIPPEASSSQPINLNSTLQAKAAKVTAGSAATAINAATTMTANPSSPLTTRPSLLTAATASALAASGPPPISPVILTGPNTKMIQSSAISNHAKDELTALGTQVKQVNGGLQMTNGNLASLILSTRYFQLGEKEKFTLEFPASQNDASIIESTKQALTRAPRLLLENFDKVKIGKKEYAIQNKTHADRPVIELTEIQPTPTLSPPLAKPAGPDLK